MAIAFLIGILVAQDLSDMEINEAPALFYVKSTSQSCQWLIRLAEDVDYATSQAIDFLLWAVTGDAIFKEFIRARHRHYERRQESRKSDLELQDLKRKAESIQKKFGGK